MTEEDARFRLMYMAAAETEPRLSSPEISILLDDFVVTGPSEEGADDGAWSLNRAAAEGYRWKAGRASNRMNYSADGRSFSASQMFDHLTEMAEFYDRRAEEAGEASRPGVAAYVGGVSASDKDVRAGSSDSAKPFFTRRLHEGLPAAELLRGES